MTRASPVVITKPDGEVIIQPAYEPHQLRQIIAAGEALALEMKNLGKMPDLDETAYVPNTFEEP